MFGIPLHVLVVHFPIALAIIAAVYDARGYFSKTPELHEPGYILTLWAAAGAGLSIASGFQVAGGGLEAAGVLAHAGAGSFGSLLLIALALLRYSVRARGAVAEPYPVLWLVMEVAAAGAIAVAAVLGHRLAAGIL